MSGAGWTPPQVSNASASTSSGPTHAVEPPAKQHCRHTGDELGTYHNVHTDDPDNVPACIGATDAAEEHPNSSSSSDSSDGDEEVDVSASAYGNSITQTPEAPLTPGQPEQEVSVEGAAPARETLYHPFPTFPALHNPAEAKTDFAKEAAEVKKEVKDEHEPEHALDHTVSKADESREKLRAELARLDLELSTASVDFVARPVDPCLATSLPDSTDVDNFLPNANRAATLSHSVTETETTGTKHSTFLT